MQKAIIFLLAVAVIALATALGIVLQEPATSTFEIDRDRASVAAELSSAQSEAEKYQGGAIKALLSARVETLRHMLTMLDQKRTSVVRRIALNYSIDAHAVEPATDAILNDILDELSGVEKTISSSKTEAARYSGGLVQSMKLMTVATEELSAAQIRMKFYTAKYGLPLPTLATRGEQTKATPSGRVVSDREAI
jgi:hypothetical protein